MKSREWTDKYDIIGGKKEGFEISRGGEMKGSTKAKGFFIQKCGLWMPYIIGTKIGRTMDDGHVVWDVDS